MGKYSVFYTLTASGYMTVEAESEDAAYELVEGDDFDYGNAIDHASTVDVECNGANLVKSAKPK